MKKSIVFASVAILLLAASCNKKSATTTTSTDVGASTGSQSGQASAGAQANGDVSLKDLLASGGSQKCTFSNSASSGTFYVGGGKSRGDFASTSAGQSVKGHMIMDGKTSYVWMDGQAQGFKTSVDANSSASTSGSTASQSVDANKKMNYSCSPWSVDSSMFSLPASVKFMDMASMQLGLPKK